VSHDSLDLDTDRQRRLGYPEVIYAAGKTVEETVAAATGIAKAHGQVLVTRCRPEQLTALAEALPEAECYERSGCVLLGAPEPTHGPVAVVSAGTSDGPVAEEAAVTLRARGILVRRLQDCGVAGVHRLLSKTDQLTDCVALVAVAGFEAALTSVVGGLVRCPVIGCPTSVGYGVVDGGWTALRSMLACCAPGVTVVNIDNGFGAGYAAADIARQAPALAKPG
jgi:NCAIR mutase (PurE)-related protein